MNLGPFWLTAKCGLCNMKLYSNFNVMKIIGRLKFRPISSYTWPRKNVCTGDISEWESVYQGPFNRAIETMKYISLATFFGGCIAIPIVALSKVGEEIKSSENVNGGDSPSAPRSLAKENLNSSSTGSSASSKVAITEEKFNEISKEALLFSAAGTILTKIILIAVRMRYMNFASAFCDIF